MEKISVCGRGFGKGHETVSNNNKKKKNRKIKYACTFSY